MTITVERPWRVLIADEREDVRTYLMTLLSREGYETVAAADGWAALQTMRRGQVDVALLDIGLSGWIGREVLEEAKELYRLGIRPDPDVCP